MDPHVRENFIVDETEQSEPVNLSLKKEELDTEMIIKFNDELHCSPVLAVPAKKEQHYLSKTSLKLHDSIMQETEMEMELQQASLARADLPDENGNAEVVANSQAILDTKLDMKTPETIVLETKNIEIEVVTPIPESILDYKGDGNDIQSILDSRELNVPEVTPVSEGKLASTTSQLEFVGNVTMDQQMPGTSKLPEFEPDINFFLQGEPADEKQSNSVDLRPYLVDQNLLFIDRSSLPGLNEEIDISEINIALEEVVLTTEQPDNSNGLPNNFNNCEKKSLSENYHQESASSNTNTSGLNNFLQDCDAKQQTKHHVNANDTAVCLPLAGLINEKSCQDKKKKSYKKKALIRNKIDNKPKHRLSSRKQVGLYLEESTDDDEPLIKRKKIEDSKHKTEKSEQTITCKKANRHEAILDKKLVVNLEKLSAEDISRLSSSTNEKVPIKDKMEISARIENVLKEMKKVEQQNTKILEEIQKLSKKLDQSKCSNFQFQLDKTSTAPPAISSCVSDAFLLSNSVESIPSGPRVSIHSRTCGTSTLDLAPNKEDKIDSNDLQESEFTFELQFPDITLPWLQRRENLGTREFVRELMRKVFEPEDLMNRNATGKRAPVNRRNPANTVVKNSIDPLRCEFIRRKVIEKYIKADPQKQKNENRSVNQHISSVCAGVTRMKHKGKFKTTTYVRSDDEYLNQKSQTNNTVSYVESVQGPSKAHCSQAKVAVKRKAHAKLAFENKTCYFNSQNNEQWENSSEISSSD